MRPPLPLLALLSFASSVVTAQYPGAAPVPEAAKPGFDAISPAIARAHLEYLAGPECAGRGTGQAGYMAAANYVAAQFKQLGLVPITQDGSYFQGVPFASTIADPEACSIAVGGTTAKIGSGLAVVRATSDAAIDAKEAVFLNAKGNEQELPETLDIEGKVVFVTTEVQDDRFSFRLNRLRPAAIIFLAENEGSSVSSIRAGTTEGGDGARGTRGPVLRLSRKLGMAISRAAGVDPSYVSPGHVNGSGPISTTAMTPVSLKVKMKSEQIYVPNVVGMIPGTDPELKAQYIGVGAHLDHLGTQGIVTYPGADDDGSGSTAMLLVARAVAMNPVKPKRSIVFMAFCGEEMGLVGSRFYTNNPLIPLTNMDFLLQMDMVGRNEEHDGELPSANVNTIHLIGSQRISTELHAATLEANKYINFVFEYDEEDVYTRSDHANFAAKGVPITFLFSGFHPDYHRPTDTVDKINFQKIVSSARLNYLVIQLLGSSPNMVVRDVGQ